LELIGEASDSKNSINTRLTNLETALTEFLQLQKQRREKDESERSKWRWVIITPMAGYVLIELLKWVFR